jgi:hypothetical protein
MKKFTMLQFQVIIYDAVNMFLNDWSWIGSEP